MMPEQKPLTPKERATALAYIVQKAVESCLFFIQEFVYIEDKDSPEIAIKFDLWPNQRDALETILHNRLVAGLKARQLGFTWLALSIATWVLLKPGKSALALSKTEEDAKELVRRVAFVLRYLPSYMMRPQELQDKNLMWFEFTATSVTIHHPGGEDSTFKAFPAGANSGRSFTGNLLIIDEWAFQDYAREIWEAAFPTINRPTGGQVIGISTMKLGTLFEEIVNGALTGMNDFKVIFWPWNTDPRRDQDWYDRAKRTLGDAVYREYPATIEEAFSQAAGRFFPEVRKDVHVKPKEENIPAHFKRYAALDYGLDRFSVLWFWVDTFGNCRIYREIAKSDVIIKDAALLMLKENNGERLNGVFAPPDMWNRRQDTGKSFAASFAEHKIFLTKSDARREQGWVAVKELLKPYETLHPQTGEKITVSRLAIDEGVAFQKHGKTAAGVEIENLWGCLTKIQRDEKDYNDVSDKNHELSHAPDALRYFATGRSLRAVDPNMNRDKHDDSIEAREARNLARLAKEAIHGKKFKAV
jgi:hypothetical protein